MSTAIDFDTFDVRIDVLLDVAREFRLSDAAAREVLGEVLTATGRWRREAERVGLAAGEQEQMSPAFEHEQREHARALVG